MRQLLQIILAAASLFDGVERRPYRHCAAVGAVAIAMVAAVLLLGGVVVMLIGVYLALEPQVGAAASCLFLGVITLMLAGALASVAVLLVRKNLKT